MGVFIGYELSDKGGEPRRVNFILGFVKIDKLVYRGRDKRT